MVEVPVRFGDPWRAVVEMPAKPDTLRNLLDDMLQLRERIVAGTEREKTSLPLARTPPSGRRSIENLLNYIVMRREDLRPLQARLAAAGLSSLGRGEPHVLANVDSVIDILRRAVEGPAASEPSDLVHRDHATGHRLLRQRARRMFGKPRRERSEYIMVTMPTEAATDFDLVDSLIESGMDVARINCAHDNEMLWAGMADNVRRAAQKRKRECRILMDLAGHKIRVGGVAAYKQKTGKQAAKPPRIHRNDWLVLSGDSELPRVYANSFEPPVAAVLTCSCPGIVDKLRESETVWIDDGKIGAVIRARSGNELLLNVHNVGPRGARIKPQKGLNFPETRMDLPTLSEKDLQDLDFVSKHAHMVGLSFAERSDDVLALQSELSARGAAELPIVAKIETAHAVRNLPDIIARSLAHRVELAVMIARGDLAIELGSVRMAEIQEEVLWLCEAAHVPVIWATQVLESLAKQGTVSRPEITDAAMSVRAECVMLNKGPYIRAAVTILGDVLQRMEAHQFKKVSRLRALHW